MKKAVFIGTCLLFLISNQLFAQGIHFYATYEKAHSEAVKQNKILFIDFYTQWCGPCKILNRDVFPLASVGEYFNSNFISVKLDAENEGKVLAKKYDIAVYPTLLFITTDGEVVNKLVGGMEAEKLIEEGKKTFGLLNDPNNISNLKKLYPQKRNDESFLSLYITKMKKLGEPPFQAIEDYLKVQRSMKHRSSRMMEFLINNSNYLLLGGAAEEIFNSNQQFYRKLATKSEEKKVNEIYSKMMRLTQAFAIENKDIAMYEIFLDRWCKLETKPYYQNYTALSLELLKLKGDMKAYKKLAIHYVDSTVNSRSVEEIWAKDKSRYEQYCKENPGGGMYLESMKESYIELDAKLQLAAIVEVGSVLLENAKKSDYKCLTRWIEHGKAVLPNNFVIPNFEANVLHKQGKKEEALQCKRVALDLTKLGYRARFPIEKELEAMENGSFVQGQIIVR
ncbi:MAG: thioredoxin family protein [Odoribacter sp.]